MEPKLEPRSTLHRAHTTPTKAKVQGIEFLEADGQEGRKTDVLKFFGVGHTRLRDRQQQSPFTTCRHSKRTAQTI